MRSTLACFFAVMLVSAAANAQPHPNAIPSANGDGIDTHLFRLALGAQVGVPVSEAPRSADADPSLWWWPSLIVERRFGDDGELRLAANVGWRGHAASATALDLKDGRVRDGNRITYGAGASLRV